MEVIKYELISHATYYWLIVPLPQILERNTRHTLEGIAIIAKWACANFVAVLVKFNFTCSLM